MPMQTVCGEQRNPLQSYDYPPPPPRIYKILFLTWDGDGLGIAYLRECIVLRGGGGGGDI